MLRRLSGVACETGRRLRRITRTTPADVARIGLCARSLDFGRPGRVKILVEPGEEQAHSGFGRAMESLWRGGAPASEFPKARPFLLAVKEILHTLRWLYGALRRR